MTAGPRNKQQEDSLVYRQFGSQGDACVIRARWAALDRMERATFPFARNYRELAGFLIGSVTSGIRNNRESRLVRIEAFVPLSHSCYSGELFNYSECDPTVFADELRAHGKARVIGMVRSNLCGSGPSKDDLALMDAHFGRTGVFLLIESFGECHGTFYISSGPRFTAASPVYRFSFARPGAEPLSSASTRDPSGSPEVSPVLEEPLSRRFRKKSYLVPVIAAASSIVLVTAAFEYRTADRGRGQTEQRENSANSLPLQLNAERETGGNEWRISWNRRGTAVSGANRGHLTIRQGAFTKELELTPADLQTGSIVLTPISDDIGIRLEVLEGQTGRSVSEAIRVVGGAFANSSITDPEGTTEFSELRRLLGTREGALSQTGLAKRTGVVAAAPATPSANVRQFVPPSGGLVTVSRIINDLPAPPELTKVPLGNPSALSIGAVRPVTPPAALRPVAKAEAVVGAAQSNAAFPTKGPGSEPPVGLAGAKSASPAETSLQPAKLLQRTEPKFPKLALKLAIPVVVRLDGDIGVDGRLHNLRALSGPDAFRTAALNAVSDWVYAPATLHGQPVIAPTKIEVRFEPH